MHGRQPDARPTGRPEQILSSSSFCLPIYSSQANSWPTLGALDVQRAPRIVRPPPATRADMLLSAASYSFDRHEARPDKCIRSAGSIQKEEPGRAILMNAFAAASAQSARLCKQPLFATCSRCVRAPSCAPAWLLLVGDFKQIICSPDDDNAAAICSLFGRIPNTESLELIMQQQQQQQQLRQQQQQQRIYWDANYTRASAASVRRCSQLCQTTNQLINNQRLPHERERERELRPSSSSDLRASGRRRDERTREAVCLLFSQLAPAAFAAVEHSKSWILPLIIGGGGGGKCSRRKTCILISTGAAAAAAAG